MVTTEQIKNYEREGGQIVVYMWYVAPLFSKFHQTLQFKSKSTTKEFASNK